MSDIHLWRLIWEISVSLIATVAAIYAWILRRSAVQNKAIDMLERRILCLEERLKNVPTRASFEHLAGEVRGLGQLLQRIERYLDRIDQTMHDTCLLYTSPSPRDRTRSRMPSSA